MAQSCWTFATDACRLMHTLLLRKGLRVVIVRQIDGGWQEAVYNVVSMLINTEITQGKLTTGNRGHNNHAHYD